MSFVPHGEPGKRRYGCWGGEPNGRPENVTRCAMSVSGGGFGMVGRQCVRDRGHGLNGEFCKQHAKHHPAMSPANRGDAA